jgi:hypothetical protein
VLVKELQGLGLRVDLIQQEAGQVDAEQVLETAVADEAANPVTVSSDDVKPLDVAAADEVDEFGEIDLGDGMSVRTSDEDEEEVKEVA